MGQLFNPKANSIAKLSLIIGGSLPVLAILGGHLISNSSYNTKVDVPLDQPVPFSHRHHAWELGIDCRYCHTSVEKSGFAGIPDTETCMTCHSQIWTNSPLLEPVRKSYETGLPIKWASGESGWNLVNNVPEFVYFDHSIHIAKGISCNTCHGDVQNMHITWKGQNFTMKWCLQCHTEPEKYLYVDKTRPDLTPREQVFNLYVKQQEDPKMKSLSKREIALLTGTNERYRPSKEEIEDGKKLITERNIKVKQLQDCWTCHR
ncbi:MAG TPA: cytochrome c3 family protein [Fimbriimonadaceae bacterium]|nr:cytochrome c3 family protein [Fimbriimonadaceae bacterium]HRJ33551.1 cytochrome c3 family protein [Fimbriimonadaceae bacterium]